MSAADANPANGGRTLVAGIGNVLRGDDGFGPAVVRALHQAADVPATIRAVEMGIGGIALVHELMDGYESLVIVDAVDRGGAPGTLYVLDVDVPQLDTLSPADRHELTGDMHQAVPERALIIARAAGVLPSHVRIIGCQPLETEEFSTQLSRAVAAAVPRAIDAILACSTVETQERCARRRESRPSP